MNESYLTRKLRYQLNNASDTYFVKIVQNAMANTGIPDLLGCHRGRLYAIECKLLRKIPKQKYTSIRLPLTPMQLYQLTKFNEAGGKSLLGLFIIPERRWLFVPYDIGEWIDKDQLAIQGKTLNELFSITDKPELWDTENEAENE